MLSVPCRSLSSLIAIDDSSAAAEGDWAVMRMPTLHQHETINDFVLP